MGKKEIEIKKIVIGKDGKKYLPVDQSGIPALMILTDGIRRVGFEGDPKLYIEIKEIIKWYKNELKIIQDKKKELYKHNIIFLEKLIKKPIKEGKK